MCSQQQDGKKYSFWTKILKTKCTFVWIKIYLSDLDYITSIAPFVMASVLILCKKNIIKNQ